jgi:hypothetical protein
LRLSTNQACSSLLWLTTRSMISRMPRAFIPSSMASKSAMAPNWAITLR